MSLSSVHKKVSISGSSIPARFLSEIAPSATDPGLEDYRNTAAFCTLHFIKYVSGFRRLWATSLFAFDRGCVIGLQ